MRSDDQHATVFGEIGFLEVTAFLDFQSAHSSIRILDSFGLDRDHAIFELVPEAVILFGTDSTDKRHFVADILKILIFELYPFSGPLTAGLHAGLAAPHDANVIA